MGEGRWVIGDARCEMEMDGWGWITWHLCCAGFCAWQRLDKIGMVVGGELVVGGVVGFKARDENRKLRVSL